MNSSQASQIRNTELVIRITNLSKLKTHLWWPNSATFCEVRIFLFLPSSCHLCAFLSKTCTCATLYEVALDSTSLSSFSSFTSFSSFSLRQEWSILTTGNYHLHVTLFLCVIWGWSVKEVRGGGPWTGP